MIDERRIKVDVEDDSLYTIQLLIYFITERFMGIYITSELFYSLESTIDKLNLKLTRWYVFGKPKTTSAKTKPVLCLILS